MRKSRLIYFLAFLAFAVSVAVTFGLVKLLKSDTAQVIKKPEPYVSDSDTIIPPLPEPMTADDLLEKDTAEEVQNQPPVPKPKKTKEELTRIINNINNNNYPRNVKLKYTNLDTSGGEEYQGSIGNLRNWIKVGYCTVTVTNVEYNETTGEPVVITMRINRNRNEEEL